MQSNTFVLVLLFSIYYIGCNSKACTCRVATQTECEAAGYLKYDADGTVQRQCTWEPSHHKCRNTIWLECLKDENCIWISKMTDEAEAKQAQPVDRLGSPCGIDQQDDDEFYYDDNIGSFAEEPPNNENAYVPSDNQEADDETGDDEGVNETGDDEGVDDEGVDDEGIDNEFSENDDNEDDFQDGDELIDGSDTENNDLPSEYSDAINAPDDEIPMEDAINAPEDAINAPEESEQDDTRKFGYDPRGILHPPPKEENSDMMEENNEENKEIMMPQDEPEDDHSEQEDSLYDLFASDGESDRINRQQNADIVLSSMQKRSDDIKIFALFIVIIGVISGSIYYFVGKKKKGVKLLPECEGKNDNKYTALYGVNQHRTYSTF